MNLPEPECSNCEGLESAQQKSSEDIVLEANDGKRLAAVNRSVHLKQQRNWKWKWWRFTTKGQVLQPISESSESPKGENALPSDGENEQDAGCPEECTTEQCENNKDNHETDGLCTQETQAENICVVKDVMITPPKDQYSACYTLIEKFQEAVLDNAVRVIQAAFKRFMQRRRFLRFKKAATVIQRNVRRWLQQRQSCVHLRNSESGDSQAISCQQHTCFAKCGICKNSDSGLEVDNLGTAFQADSVTHDCEIVKYVGQKTEDSKSDLQPDAWYNSLSPLENLKLEEPDSLSLTDSGIDACSMTSVEAVIEENNLEFKAGIAHGISEDSISRASPVLDQGEEVECQELYMYSTLAVLAEILQ